ncbi:MAG: LPS translocon maturation chaperone LptM [Rubrivivax sp.]
MQEQMRRSVVARAGARPRMVIAALGLGLAAAALSGCGQKGPLTLPAASPAAPPTASAPAR